MVNRIGAYCPAFFQSAGSIAFAIIHVLQEKSTVFDTRRSDAHSILDTADDGIDAACGVFAVD